MSNNVLKLSDVAAEKIKEILLSADKKSIGGRVGVKS